MADKKISECEFATVINSTDIIPVVQLQANKKITFGQLKTFNFTPSISTIVAGTITPTQNGIYKISGNCILSASTGEGTTITVISTDLGKLISVGLLPNDGMSFTGAGATTQLIWVNSVWNILTVYNMTNGII